MDDVKNTVELKEGELEEVSGGKISFVRRPDRAGWSQHQVQPGDTLIRIASRYGIANWRSIRDWNPHINQKSNMIIDGEWLWIRI